MNISDSWLQTTIAFVFGVIGTVVVSIIANLLTPNRDTLIIRYKDWRAKKSSKAAKNRIQELESEQKIIDFYSQNESRFVLFLFGQLFTLLMYLLQGIFAFGVYTYFQSIFTQVSPPPPQILINIFTGVFGLIFIWNFVRALFTVDEINKMIANVHNYSSYKLKTENMLEGLQKIAKTEIKA